MSYIGKTPTAVPLTSSDIADDIINSTHIGDTAISGFSALATAPADTDEFLISDGGVLKRLDASLVGGGNLGQVLQGYKTTAETFSSSATDYDIADLTVTVTPASSSSKFLIISNIGGYSQNGSPQIFIKCNSTGSFATVGVNTIASRRNTSFSGNIYTGDASGTAEMFFSSNTCFLHSPNVSSEIIYKISGNANGETRINIKESDASGTDAGVSNITVMEILG